MTFQKSRKNLQKDKIPQIKSSKMKKFTRSQKVKNLSKEKKQSKREISNTDLNEIK